MSQLNLRIQMKVCCEDSMLGDCSRGELLRQLMSHVKDLFYQCVNTGKKTVIKKSPLLTTLPCSDNPLD